MSHPNQPHPGQLPPQQGYPQYPTPPAPKKSHTLRTILIILAVIVAVCGIGGALMSKGSSSSSSPGTDPNKPLPGLNTPVRDGKFEFVITAVQSGVKTLGDNEFLQKTAQGTYTVVSISITNTSDKPYGFSPSDQYVFDAKNRKFSNDPTAAINLQSDTSLYANLNPGNTITAQVVYDLPADSAPDHMVLHDSMFSGGVTVSLH
ncbi:DUF4352 domain-containing protein [Nocardia sp. NBC_01503]|uniref:DUF4352 domain-containing protein n=1 Tax=Nocardia sp. NBC_01503 TaxID=2975997 RepID=UPI002E7BFB01|nr:DUF4352 domain-containing protein [Nocardia sp. NBC_01503]WTL32669.1 DUF4352 domain-containing protein [Nocardia sp. NBC_01503]